MVVSTDHRGWEGHERSTCMRAMQCNGWPSNKRGIDIETFRAQKHSRNKQKKKKETRETRKKERKIIWLVFPLVP